MEPSSNMEPIRAVLFDMDGTMFDTEKLWGAVTRALAASYALTWDERVRTQMMGKKDSEALAVFKEYFKCTATVDELVARRRELILTDLSMVAVNPGLYELLDVLEEKGIRKAVATSSFRQLTDALLSQFQLTERFDAIVTGDDVTKSKPDPEIFLEAARRVSIEPSACLVLEDAQNGVEAAANAGMRVFALPHDDSAHHDFSRATRVLGSLLEVPALL